MSAQRKRMKILLVLYGTRSEALKLLPVIRASRDSGQMTVVTCALGQHPASLIPAELVHADIEFPSLGSGALAGRLAELLARCTRAIDQSQPHAVLVQGDTSSALAGALAGSYAQKIICHLEAGLRTTDMNEPFPEERHRRVISSVTNLHLCTSEHAMRNLIGEGIDPGLISVVPNPLRDYISNIVERIPTAHENAIVITLHRRERREQRFSDLIHTACDLQLNYRVGNPLIFVWHPSLPDSYAERLKTAGIHIVEPLSHGKFLQLLSKASVVVTDSGGVAEEADLLGRPLVVPRRFNERAGITRSYNVFEGDADRLSEAVLRAMRDGAEKRAEVEHPGRSAGRVCADAIITALS